MRHQLEPPDIEPNSVLQVDNTHIRLNRSVIETDLLRFQTAASRAQRAATIEDRMAHLRNAVSQYRGELLPGFFFDWILAEREQVTSLFLRVVRTVIVDMKESGQTEDALGYAQQAAGLSPDNDRLHLEVLALQLSLGLHDEAIVHYRDYRDVLRREYGRPPGLSLQQLMSPYADRLVGSPRRSRRSKAPNNEASSTQLTEQTWALNEPPASFPAPFNRFFGRETELAQISRFVAPEVYSDSDSRAYHPARLFTVVGMGGCGKTRLVIEAGHLLRLAFIGRSLFVPLGALTHADNVAHAILSALAEPQSIGPADARVRRALKHHRWLVVLDNCEHLMPNVAIKVRDLLEDLPDLRIVATSRMPLGLNGEQVLPLMPFDVPHSAGSPQALFEFPCVQMFVDRAQAVNPDFQLTTRNAGAIAHIAERLEGVPLAIELAATHAHVLTPTQILEALVDRFKLLVTRQIRDKRHRALVDAIEWSYALLPEGARRAFCALSVFRGGFTVEAARGVTGAEEVLVA